MYHPIISNVKYLVYTIYLFTRSDIKTFVTPQALFGILSAFAGPLLTNNETPNTIDILYRVPLVFLWTWLNVLIFDLANQRLPHSVMEDKINKPWRPMAAGRLTIDQARRLLLIAAPAVFLIIHFGIGASEETVLLYTLNWMYNDLGGSDDGWIIRNVILAIAFIVYNSGTLRIASGDTTQFLTPGAKAWLVVIGLTIMATMSIQDLRDIPGDRAKNRKTAPIVLGETTCRYMLAAGVLISSMMCSIFWNLDQRIALLLLGFGATLAARVLVTKGQQADRKTYGMWSLWLSSIYALPLVKFSAAMYLGV